MKKQGFIIVWVLLHLLISNMTVQAQMPAAISIQPENATFYDEITLTLDVDLACYQNGSLAGLSSVGMHSGVTINGGNWQYVVAFNSVGANGQSPVLEANPDGTFSITFTPYEFYGFPAGSGVTHICAVFNNGTGWEQDARDFLQGGPDCTDFFIPINTGTPYEPGLSSIVPDHGYQGESLNVQIFGINTHFVNGSTQIWLDKDGNSIDISTYYAVNDTLIAATLIIPEDAISGNWSLNVETPEDGLLTLSEAFAINSLIMPEAITIDPANASAYDQLTLTFDPAESCFEAASLVGASQVYFHSGVAFYSGDIWQFVVGYDGIGANGQSPQMTDNGDGTWSISFIPFEYYGFEQGSVVTHICAVFNDGTWDKDGRDFALGTQDCQDFFIPLNFSTGVEDIISASIIVKPNPAKEFIEIESKTELQSFYIINYLGQVVKEGGIAGGFSTNIDIKDMAKGLYIISFIDKNNGLLISKLLKE
jgi:hypothetical protein